MNLISETEQARILKEALQQRCEGTRMNDPHWALGIVFSVMGLMMVLSSLGELVDPWMAVLGATHLFVGLHHWGRWQRRKVVCVLHGVLVQEADACANGAKSLEPRCPDTAGGGLQG